MHRTVAFVSILIAFIASELFFYIYLAADINSNLIFQSLYFGTLILFFGTFYRAFTVDRVETGEIKSFTANFLFGFAFTLFITKLTFVIIALLGESGSSIWGLFSPEGSIYRREWIKLVAFIIAALPFLSFLYGITKGKYNFKVINVPLYFSDLPKEFDGYKVV